MVQGEQLEPPPKKVGCFPCKDGPNIQPVISRKTITQFIGIEKKTLQWSLKPIYNVIYGVVITCYNSIITCYTVIYGGYNLLQLHYNVL